MALIKCAECGREISDAAAACPGCGYLIKVQDEPSVAADPPQTADPQQPAAAESPTILGVSRVAFLLMVVLGLLGFLIG